MPSELHVIEAGQIIGEFNLGTREVFVNNDLPIKFTCKPTVQCCSKLEIPVSDKDILRIEKLGYSLNQIVKISSPYIQIPKTEESGVEKYYWIKRKAFTNTCRFLDDHNKCIIYENRPLGCRVFPFLLEHLSKNLVRVKIHPTNICKSVEIAETGDNNAILEELLEVYDRDLAEKRTYFEEYGNKI